MTEEMHKTRTVARTIKLTMRTPDEWDREDRIKLQSQLAENGFRASPYGWSKPSLEDFYSTTKKKTHYSIRINDDLSVDCGSSLLNHERELVGEALTALAGEEREWWEDHIIEEDESPGVKDGDSVWFEWEDGESLQKSISLEEDTRIRISKWNTKSPLVGITIQITGPTIEACDTEAVRDHITRLSNLFKEHTDEAGCTDFRVDCSINAHFVRTEVCDASFLFGDIISGGEEE